MITPRLNELNKNEVLTYLGYTGQKYGPELDEQINKCIDETISLCNPRLIYKELPLTDNGCDGLPLEGNDIHDLIAGCSRIVIMAATIGRQISDIILQKTVSDMTAAAILNSCGSTAIENVCENFEDDLRAQLKEQGLFLTDRFSPGYGDLPLSTQKPLCSLLDTSRKIGIVLTDSYLMIPEKSVTAIMGISDQPVKHRKKECYKCNLFETCSYRKNNTKCDS